MFIANAMPTADADPAGEPVTREQCNHWSSSIYQYEFSAALSAGFQVGAVKASDDYRLLVMDVARTTNRTVGDKVEQWGFGYRLKIEIDKASVVASLTLPAIAASVEVKGVQASVSLEVTGYEGDDMWGPLPVPQPLNVETYKTFLDAAAKVQAVFAKRPDAAVPVLLSTGSVDSIAANGVSQAEARDAVALVAMLNAAREGVDQARAVDAATAYSDIGDGEARLLAQGLYATLGSDGPAVADALLEPLRQAGWRLP
jgi:hypothetical protein